MLLINRMKKDNEKINLQKELVKANKAYRKAIKRKAINRILWKGALSRFTDSHLPEYKIYMSLLKKYRIKYKYFVTFSDLEKWEKRE